MKPTLMRHNTASGNHISYGYTWNCKKDEESHNTASGNHISYVSSMGKYVRF